MSTSAGQTLRELFERFRMKWFLDAFPSDPATLMDRFGAFTKKYEQRMKSVEGGPTLPKTVDISSLCELAEKNPNSLEAFLQVFASSCSPEMLAMTWALQHDLDVSQIDLEFKQRESFTLQIELQASRNDTAVTFEAESIFDMAVLRHFGVLQASGNPVISGLFPLNFSWDDT